MRKGLLKKKTDQQLIMLYQESGNTGYVGELFQRYSHLISALSLKYLKNATEAEDAVMEIFEILVRDLKTHEVKNFSAWLYSVTKNHCLKKKNKADILYEDPEILNKQNNFMENPEDEDLDNRRLKETRLDEIKIAIENLTGEQKECIKLFYIESKSYKEISDMTGHPLKKVKSYIQNGKRKLKIHIESNE